MNTSVGWDADPLLEPWAGFAALTEALTADACVVGLGGSGLAAVDELLSRGLSVVGLDAGRVAGAAAGRNGGFLLGGGAPSVPDACRDWGADLARALYRRTMTELDRLIEQLGPDVIRRVGSIRLAGLPGDPVSAEESADRDRELTDCAAQLQLLGEFGVPVQSYDGALGQGIFMPADAVMNPARRGLGLASLLAGSAGSAGSARLFEHSAVTSIAPGRVDTAAGSVSAGVVIVAVDGHLDVLLPQLAPLVRTARLQMLATAPGQSRRLPCAVYGRWGYDYAQQDASGRLFVGGGRDRFEAQEWTHDDQPTPGVQTWIEQVAARMAGTAVSVAHRWAASVGFTADGRALCIEVDDGVVACGGYSGTGNLVGPVAARDAVALALDGTAPPGYFRSSAS